MKKRKKKSQTHIAQKKREQIYTVYIMYGKSIISRMFSQVWSIRYQQQSLIV